MDNGEVYEVYWEKKFDDFGFVVRFLLDWFWVSVYFERIKYIDFVFFVELFVWLVDMVKEM